MNRLLAFVLLIACLIQISTAQDSRSMSGGSARHISLGGGPINPYLVDVSRVHVNPALLGRFANFMWADIGYLRTDASGQVSNFGGGMFQYAGTNVRLGKGWTVAVILNKREGALFTMDPGAGVDPTSGARDPISTVNAAGLGIGRPMSPVELGASLSATDDLALGLSASVAGWSDRASSTGGTTNVSSKVTAFKAGASYQFGSGRMLDGALVLRLNDMDFSTSANGANPSSAKMNNGVELAGDARLIWELDDEWSLLPIARFYSFGWGPEIASLPPQSVNPPDEFTRTEYEVGLGTNYKTDKVLLVGGVSLHSVSSEWRHRVMQVSKVTTTEMDLPKINMGIEFSLIDWLIARAGYFKRLSSVETKNESGTSSTHETSRELPYYGDPNGLSESQQAFTLGVGVHFSGFSLDGTIAEGYFINGPWVLSGQPQSLFGVVSMHYMW